MKLPLRGVCRVPVASNVEAVKKPLPLAFFVYPCVA